MAYIQKCIDVYCREHNLPSVTWAEFGRLNGLPDRPDWVIKCREYIILQKVSDRVDAYHDEMNMSRRPRDEVETALKSVMQGMRSPVWFTSDMVAFISEPVQNEWTNAP